MTLYHSIGSSYIVFCLPGVICECRTRSAKARKCVNDANPQKSKTMPFFLLYHFKIDIFECKQVSLLQHENIKEERKWHY